MKRINMIKLHSHFPQQKCRGSYVPKTFHEAFHQLLLKAGYAIEVKVTRKRANRRGRCVLEIPVCYKLFGPEKAFRHNLNIKD